MALNERDPRDPRIERLYREAAREAPPAHLDAAILAAARREVGARPRGLSAALRRWHVPVSIAAVVVVSVSLVILMKEEGGDRLDEARVARQEASADRAAAEPAQAPSAAVAMNRAQPLEQSPALAEQGVSRNDPKRSAALGKAEGSPAAISGIGASAPERAAEPSPRPLMASPPLPAREPAATPAPPDTAAPGRLEVAAPASGEGQSAATEADVPQPRPMARAIVAKPVATDQLPVWQGLDKEPPEKWLARIEELTREGRTAEAEEMRVEFRRRFPVHPLGRASK